MGDLTRNFSKDEFTCQHCGAEGIEMKLVEALQKLRDYFDLPIYIVSGYRCPEHRIEKAKVKRGRKPGYHAKGLAADIVIPGFPAQRLVNFLLLNGSTLFPEFKGIGLNEKGHTTHLDVRTSHAGEIVKWKYDQEGNPVAWA